MTDKVVLITGGAGNLGRVVTRSFLEAGARVAVPYYQADHTGSLEALRREFPQRLHTYALDLTTEKGAEQAVRQAVEWGKALNAVVHLVGGYSGGRKVSETPLGTWVRMLDLNMTTAYLVSRFALDRMAAGGGGSLVFVSSRAAFEKGAGHAAYAATKAGLATLARTIAEEYADERIRSNVIVPDTIDTEENRRAMPDADRSGWTDPESIARVILFLVSDEAKAISGAVVPVFGSP